MVRHLDPCPACSRHIAASETRCPMCDSALVAGWARAPVAAPPAGAGRAARFAWRLVLATTAGACGARTDVTVNDAGSDGGMLLTDAGRDAGFTRDAGRDAGGLGDGGNVDGGGDAEIDAGDIPIYGAPPPDELPQPRDVLAPPDPVVPRRARRGSRT